MAGKILRSSSLLEDNFGFSFAGKYEEIEEAAERLRGWLA